MYVKHNLGYCSLQGCNRTIFTVFWKKNDDLEGKTAYVSNDAMFLLTEQFMNTHQLINSVSAGEVTVYYFVPIEE